MITDLTGTTWYFNSQLGRVDFGYELDFSSNGTSYDYLEYSDGINGFELWYNNTDVYGQDGWVNSDYRTIEILGGWGATDPYLISWLEQNATLQTSNVFLTIDPANGTWNGSSSPSSIAQDPGTTYSVSDPVRAGYNFTGWSLSGGGALSNGVYTFGDTDGTLTANWVLIIVEYIATNAEFMDVADRIRTKGGTNASLSWPNGFKNAIDEIGNITLDSIITRTISGIYENSTAIAIGYGAFMGCTQLLSVNFSNCRNIYSSAFRGCSKLTTAIFPLCGSVHSSAFEVCSNLATISFPNCYSVGSYAFNGCASITDASFPKCVSIHQGAFRNCDKLVSVSFPDCASIYLSAFQYCSTLATAFFPKCTKIWQSAFEACRNLTTASFPKCTSIYSTAFRYCYKLLSFYILTSSIATLAYTNAFDYTPISTYTTSTSGANGSIFVRSSLLTTWKTATNWATYSTRFVGLTDEQIAALG